MVVPQIHPKTMRAMAEGRGGYGIGGGQIVPHFFLMRDSRIIPLADSLWQKAGKRPDRYTEAVFEYVTKHVGYGSDEDVHGLNEYVEMPGESLDLGWADCEGTAMLMVALLTIKGVPCHVSFGYAGSGSHRWPEVKYKDGWYIFDTTNGDIFPKESSFNKGYVAMFYVTPHSFRPSVFPVPLFLP